MSRRKWTSDEAYRLCWKNLGTLRFRVYQAIYDAGKRGITRQELYNGRFFGIQWSTLTGRVWELLQTSTVRTTGVSLVVEGPDTRVSSATGKKGLVLRAPRFAKPEVGEEGVLA